MYTDGGRSWHTQSVGSPTWPVIEEAIRRLDKYSRPFLFLRLSGAQGDEEERLEVMGGDGDYWIAGSFNGYSQRRLMNRRGSDAEVQVWKSDQGYADADRHICHDAEVVLRIARYFFDHADFDPSVEWEQSSGDLGAGL